MAMDSIVSMLLADNSGAFPTGEVAAYAWPGGYPLFYLVRDGEALCPACVNAEIERIMDVVLGEDTGADWDVVGRDVNWEDSSLFCAHCNKRIESAYAEDEAEG